MIRFSVKTKDIGISEPALQEVSVNLDFNWQHKKQRVIRLHHNFTDQIRECNLNLSWRAILVTRKCELKFTPPSGLLHEVLVFSCGNEITGRR